MKHLFYFVMIASFGLSVTTIAQPNEAREEPKIEVQFRKLPPSDEGSYYDQSAPSPQIQSDYRQEGQEIPDAYQNERRSESFRGQESTDSSRFPNQPNLTVDNMPQRNVEQTLVILKPDAVRNRHIGDIISRYEDHGLHIVALEMLKMNKEQAAQFYNIHRDQPFFNKLVDFMSSGPVVVMVLEGDHAISKNRQLIGATDPSKAEKGTIRGDFAESISQNTVHGSDSAESARREIPFFFKSGDIYSGY